ncbi:hypothetical protein ONS95_005276 [Cadophora gregata]|uniref:uncharacterized protein n=1 Tax=Cadophora gregata TaxID=51156 RepID=UPI0026DC08ED|nr:uncharacterized protein ONS95_005276 [Cadophora gregata]KAK0103242.1 hypothetical protein ONS95_005276 [Cadophora gregata]KAK0107432.1 hypothetical protein ONS96_003249 [Cadophora gregata f. sp. sojae]
MSGNPFTKLKFVTKSTKKEPTPGLDSSSQSFNGPSQSTQSHPSQSTPPSDVPAPARPAPVPTKSALKIKFNTKSGSVPPTPTAAVEPAKPKKSKAGRPPKPSAKLLESKKRAKEDDHGSDADGSTIQVVQPSKKLKLNTGGFEKPKGVKLSLTSKTPVAKTPATPFSTGSVRIKPKGKKPPRPPGDGYDSEASDREDDPHIEEQFILRMVPGDDAEYVKYCIEKKLIGISKSSGGAEIIMKFYEDSGRRGALQVRGNWYASTLVDLPTITEGMKSWDKRGWWKSADICQMLWVFARVRDEQEAKTIPLPSIIDPSNYQYPHGLTAPMHNCRKRRFRKRIHRDEIEKTEREVQRLLEADRKCTVSKYHVFDPNARQQSQSYSRDGSTPARYGQAQQYSEDEEDEEEDDNEDAEGEEDDGYFTQNHGQSGATHAEANFNSQLGGDADADGDIDAQFGIDFEADLEAALEMNMNEEELEAATPMSTVAATPATGDILPGADTENQEDSGGESFEDDDDDDDEGSEMDDEEKERMANMAGVREDIAEMERTLAENLAKRAVASNHIIKARLDSTIRNLKNEIQLKKSSIGEGEGE